MYNNEAESFAKFLVYKQRFWAADLVNYCKIKKHKDTSNFQATFFALASLRLAYLSMQSFIRVDSTYTSSRF
jgi:hypothetical protein